MSDILLSEYKNEEAIQKSDADTTEDIIDTKGEISEQSESKFSVDCSIQAGVPSVKMVRFKVDIERLVQ